MSGLLRRRGQSMFCGIGDGRWPDKYQHLVCLARLALSTKIEQPSLKNLGKLWHSRTSFASYLQPAKLPWGYCVEFMPYHVLSIRGCG